MAGRYVLLEFDDHHEANTFVNAAYKGGNYGKVLGVYMSPRKFCECPDKQRQDNRNWFKGKRTGLFLCRRCRRPSSFHQRGLMARLQHVLGFDIRETE